MMQKECALATMPHSSLLITGTGHKPSNTDWICIQLVMLFPEIDELWSNLWGEYVRVSRFEQAFVSSLVFGRSADQFWLGLYNENSTGTFRWITGEELTYTNWNRNQPGEYGVTMCAPE